MKDTRSGFGAGLLEAGYAPEKIGIIFGTGLGGFPHIEAHHKIFLEKGHIKSLLLMSCIDFSSIINFNIILFFKTNKVMYDFISS
jgi:hypothetical protein